MQPQDPGWSWGRLRKEHCSRWGSLNKGKDTGNSRRGCREFRLARKWRGEWGDGGSDRNGKQAEGRTEQQLQARLLWFLIPCPVVRKHTLCYFSPSKCTEVVLRRAYSLSRRTINVHVGTHTLMVVGCSVDGCWAWLLWWGSRFWLSCYLLPTYPTHHWKCYLYLQTHFCM